MTALFVVIAIDQWQGARDHLPAVGGAVIAVVCLLIFGGSSFMLPALLAVSAALMLRPAQKEEHA